MINALPDKVYENYLYHLVGRFFKILPMKEDNSPTLRLYLESFRNDLLGYAGLAEYLDSDARLLELINTLQFFLLDDYDDETCRREVMKCIGIVKTIYADRTGKVWSK